MVLVLEVAKAALGQEPIKVKGLTKEAGKSGFITGQRSLLIVVTFNVKCGRCLVCSTIAQVLSFVFVCNFIDGKCSMLSISLYSDHLRGLNLSLVVVPHDIHIFVELTL